ncbi:MAG: head GIN domain-containing protein [Sphingomonadaceae bacterium]|jgi:hypothetical protein
MKFRPFCAVPAMLAFLAPASAVAAEKRYAISDFDRVQVFGPFNVTIQPGRATSVTATGDLQALDIVSVTSSGGILTIQTLTRARSSWKEEPHPAAKILVVLPQLKGVRLLGSGSVAVAELRGIATNITLNGGGLISIAKLTSDAADVYLSGSGRISLGGSAKNISIKVSGSGDIDSSMLSASDLKIESGTSGRVVAKALRTADIKQTGPGEVHVNGSPSCLVENSGAGTVDCGR